MITGVDLDFTVMTEEELSRFRQSLHGDPASTAGSQPAHGHAEGRTIPFADPSSPDPGAADRLGQGRGRQVVGHHQPGRRAGAAGSASA